MPPRAGFRGPSGRLTHSARPASELAGYYQWSPPGTEFGENPHFDISLSFASESFSNRIVHGDNALMKYRTFGRTRFDVSEIAHGLWGMSGWSGSDDRESLAAMQLGIDLGCNFFDTAWAYGEGKSDGLLGEIMARNITRNPGKRLYAASKIPPANDRWPAQIGR